MAKKEKKEKKAKKPSSGRLRAFVGVVIAILLFGGVVVCDSLTTGKNLFSFVSTGSVMDRFDEASRETSKKETENFFGQAAYLFMATAEEDQKYTSYSMTYTINEEEADAKGHTYTNKWREVSAMVDKDYTVYTVSNRFAEGLTYTRTVSEYVFCKTGANAGRAWKRSGTAEQSVGDVDILEKATWTEIDTTKLKNEAAGAFVYLNGATYGDYDVVDSAFNFTVTTANSQGSGKMKPGVMPSLSFSYMIGLEREDTAHHLWTFSHLNATKAIVPKSLASVLGGAV